MRSLSLSLSRSRTLKCLTVWLFFTSLGCHKYERNQIMLSLASSTIENPLAGLIVVVAGAVVFLRQRLVLEVKREQQRLAAVSPLIRSTFAWTRGNGRQTSAAAAETPRVVYLWAHRISGGRRAAWATNGPTRAGDAAAASRDDAFIFLSNVRSTGHWIPRDTGALTYWISVPS